PRGGGGGAVAAPPPPAPAAHAASVPAPAPLLIRLDEDVDLVGPLAPLLVGHAERGGGLAHLGVGVHRVLLRALRAVAEVPAEGERAPALLLHRSGELHL